MAPLHRKDPGRRVVKKQHVLVNISIAESAGMIIVRSYSSDLRAQALITQSVLFAKRW